MWKFAHELVVPVVSRDDEDMQPLIRIFHTNQKNKKT